jgi:predicted nucleotidyltransferase
MNEQVPEIRDKILNILKYNDVKRASLFGSVVRGELADESDIDILIEFEGKKSLLDLVGLKFDLEDKLKRKVDVLTYNSLSPHLKDKILNEQEVIL